MKLVCCYEDSFIVESINNENKKKLTIAAHGHREGLMINRKFMDASALQHNVRYWTTLCDLNKIHLIACNTASRRACSAGTKNLSYANGSLGYYLSLFLPHVYIKCYAGKINAVNPESTWVVYRRFGSSYLEKILRNCQMINENPRLRYHCITYLNGNAIKQKYPVFRCNGREYGVL